MTKKMIVIPLILALLVTGCIVTGNILVVIELEDKTLTTSDSFDKWLVSKDEHQEWKDHADDINHIVDVGFAVTLDNGTSNVDATGEFYISKIGTLIAKDLHPDSSNAYIILSGLVVKAGEVRKITWQESYDFLSNFKTLKQYGMDGEFWLYVKGVGTPLNLQVKKPAVIITLNAKP
ncbi:MAG: hypothetical protein KAT85_03970 [candidate division Zixibacteria bacterium]|nr:hypothetical protein [candidate division Zixibacteria bacterium]